eukprot:CAMPEP_0113726172 /NCGR_PEP_ID=MMETSP0038_2-20120614/40244_1 /TAXON_ID=2898 /ORGANISM="Cryptomonas paramecium" /LENGTH=73 /DNA_ID=CAMNT_0000656669 /DNA_START=251 /DNA_END=469 /DNA_ORIENTATION=+ /assembly_acc=CAM_ASM_000170
MAARQISAASAPAWRGQEAGNPHDGEADAAHGEVGRELGVPQEGEGLPRHKQPRGLHAGRRLRRRRRSLARAA